MWLQTPFRRRCPRQHQLDSDRSATTVAPAALSSRYVQTCPGQELSRTYATTRSIAGFRQIFSTNPIKTVGRPTIVCAIPSTGYTGYTGTIAQSVVTVAKPGSSLLVDRSRCIAVRAPSNILP
ncbi:unnamed protein product [Symbiodinium sp. CCMP2592]|nr:unnamed protein product [Symbiodinium sp. CCMP2592]